jgi:hypothetical protein
MSTKQWFAYILTLLLCGLISLYESEHDRWLAVVYACAVILLSTAIAVDELKR